MPYLTGANTARPHETLYWRFGEQWAIRKGDWKLVANRIDGVDKPPALYNLKDDIGEAKDLATAKPEKAKELQADWKKWNAEQMEPLWLPMPKKKDKRIHRRGRGGRREENRTSDEGEDEITIDLLSSSLRPCALCGESHSAERPNLVVLLADDMRWDAMGCAGNPVIHTPHLDVLAKDGVRFKNAFVTTAICAASRASLLTGLYERTHRFTFNTRPIADEHVDLSYPALLREV